jgi:hypothetical protein
MTLFGNAAFVGYFHHEAFVADLLRCFCIVAGSIVVGLLIRLARIVRNTRQWGIYGSICAFTSVVLTEMDQLGTVPSLRLLLNVMALVFSGVYLKKMNFHLAQMREKSVRDVKEQHELEEKQLEEGIQMNLPKHRGDAI